MHRPKFPSVAHRRTESRRFSSESEVRLRCATRQIFQDIAQLGIQWNSFRRDYSSLPCKLPGSFAPSSCYCQFAKLVQAWEQIANPAEMLRGQRAKTGCFPTFNAPPLWQRKSRGVAVQEVNPMNPRISQTLTLAGKGGAHILPPPFNKEAPIPGIAIRHKFVVVDFTGQEPILYCGSTN